MPIQACAIDGVSGLRWGASGTCHTGPGARAKALRQARAIQASRRRRSVTTNARLILDPMKADPSRTAGIRARFQREVSRRFNKLKGKILRLVVDEDAFGLGRTFNEDQSGGPSNAGQVSLSGANPGPPSLNQEEWHDGRQKQDTDGIRGISRRRIRAKGPAEANAQVRQVRMESATVDIPSPEVSHDYDDIHRRTVANQHFAFQTDPAKVASFQQWIAGQIEAEIFAPAVGQGAQPYWEAFVEEGYRQGAGRAFTETRVAQRALAEQDPTDLAFFQGTREEFLRSSFAQPVAIEKVQLLAGRTLTDLRGVTSAMSTEMSRVLVEGLSQGQNPRVIARNLNRAVEDIGRDRALKIARTEIIRAHAEGQLDAFENLGVTEVGVMAEWSTAGDDRVCFPAWTTVETATGPKPIQDIKPGEQVWTRRGLRKVVAVSARPYAGGIARVEAGGFSVVATEDHPIWTQTGWKRADALGRSDTLQAFPDKQVNVRSVGQFRLSNATDSPSSLCEVNVLAAIAGRVSVPIGAVDLQGDTAEWDQEVDRISADPCLLCVPNGERVESKADSLFDRGLRVRPAIARKGTELPCGLAWASAELCPTSLARNHDRRASALFRTVETIDASVDIGPFVPKAFAATLAVNPLSLSIFGLAGERTVVVPVLGRGLHHKRTATTDARFLYRKATAGIVARPGTEPAVAAFGSIDDLEASRARHIPPAPIGCQPALPRAKSTRASILHRLVTFGKRLATRITDKGKRHYWRLLSGISLLYHRLWFNATRVYDIQVEGEPEFFANGLLVHNCPLCLPLEGTVMTVKEARGLIPRHVQCRCAFVPANVGESTAQQKRTQGEIRKALADSIKAEIPDKGRLIKGVGRRFKNRESGRFTRRRQLTQAERTRRSRWTGADKRIAKKRPTSTI